jgi:hypothetical protein
MKRTNNIAAQGICKRPTAELLLTWEQTGCDLCQTQQVFTLVNAGLAILVASLQCQDS